MVFLGGVPHECDEIRVKVNSYGPGRPLSLVYFDPISGKKIAKSAGTTDWGKPNGQAGELEKELRAGRYAPPSKVTWADFRKRYEAEKLPAIVPQDGQQLQGGGKPLGTCLEPRPAGQADGGGSIAFSGQATGRGHGGSDHWFNLSAPASSVIVGR